MNIFLAGQPGGGYAHECTYDPIKRLLSYILMVNGHKNFVDQKFERLRNMDSKIDLFVDSGGYSAKWSGVEIDIYKYCEFIHDNSDLITVYANLDVIGDPEGTWKNQKIMEKEGLNPLPIFHAECAAGPDIKYLYRAMEYDYFCLGGMSRGFGKPERDRLIGKCFSIICDTKDNMPQNKVHGFGLTDLTLIFKYPWYSVDSTRWIKASRNGKIFVPWWNGSKWIFTRNMLEAVVTHRPSGARTKGKNFKSMNPKAKQRIIDYLDYMGYQIGSAKLRKVSLDYKLKEGEVWANKKPKNGESHRYIEIVEEPGVSNQYSQRDELNALFFLEVEKQIPPWPWPYKNTIQVQEYSFGV